MEKQLLKEVHRHILDELRVNTKTDTTFVLTSILINVGILITNAIIADNASWNDNGTDFIVMGLFVLLLIVVNLVAEVGLIRGRQTRSRLLEGLIRMYDDNGVGEYYDRSVLGAYRTRYTLFMTVVLVTGLLALVIPVVLI